jgi:putative membrane protein
VKSFRGLLARILITAFGLWLADVLLDGISFSGALPLFLAALLLGFVNAVVRPVVVFLTFPVTLVTLGLFLFVINGGMIALVAWIMPTFHVAGLLPAIFASVIVGLTGWIANGTVGDRGGFEVWNSRRTER